MRMSRPPSGRGKDAVLLNRYKEPGRPYLNPQDEDGAVLSTSEDEVVVGRDNQGRHRAGVHGEFEARRQILRQRPVVHAHPTAERVVIRRAEHVVDSFHTQENEMDKCPPSFMERTSVSIISTGFLALKNKYFHQKRG